MTASFTHYGWQLSYFSGKTRSYLHYKGIPFVDQPVDLPTLMLRIRQKTGAVVMPVLVTPEREWIQDTSVIIDRMEARFPARPVLPQTPVQRFASYVLEVWGDEFWIPAAMHTRWSHPENLSLFRGDAGKALLPWAPAFLQQRAAGIPVQEMQKHLPGVGVVPAQFAVLDRWINQTLDRLDAHFAQHDFLLGARPTLGDFSLYGPLYGHLGRDPWPKRELIAPRVHVRAWIERMANAAASAGQALQGEDEIPASLAPVFKAIFAELLPMIDGINRQVRAALPGIAAAKALPRGLADVEFPLGNGSFRRAALPYTLWMVQRTLDVYRQMLPGEQRAVRHWLALMGGEHWLALDIPRLRRVGLRVAAEVSV
jgi:glutathione S-transferase